VAIPEGPLHGDALLSAVNDAMVELHERYYHRPPGTAKCQMMGDDLLACVLGSVYTDVEKTLIELQRAPVVQDNRNAFQRAMEERFITAVETLSGRRVAMFISSHNVGPDLEVELFFFAGPRADSGEAQAADAG
jgi:uncharacterized protein YbcI